MIDIRLGFELKTEQCKWASYNEDWCKIGGYRPGQKRMDAGKFWATSRNERKTQRTTSK